MVENINRFNEFYLNIQAYLRHKTTIKLRKKRIN